MSSGKKTCPECGVSVKETNYERHLQRVHGKGLEELKAAEKEHHSSGGDNKTKLLVVAVIVILIVSIMAYYLVFLTAKDSDGDGMSDEWETENGFDPDDPLDALGDKDGDGLTNLEEYEEGTNPKNPDMDGDGMPDGYEVTYGLDPKDPTDRDEDPDVDGATNFEEFGMGTDPHNSDTDGDGMPDKYEQNYGFNPTDASDGQEDRDGDGLVNADEYTYFSDPGNSDTDDDGMPDKYEVDNGLDPRNAGDANKDADLDGYTNLHEYTLGTNPIERVIATIVIEGYDESVVVELRPDVAPITVSNFIDYSQSGFYSDTIFHRVIDSFMIQGGGFDTNYNKKPTDPPILIERTIDTGLLHVDGAIAMARTSDPNSATSQFYICDGAQDQLDAGGMDPDGYAVFGLVTSGMETVRDISAVQTENKGGALSDAPVIDVIISSVTITWED
ncbi:MAG: peptidylprolyl isomerase [Thermoplasmata archaeon]|nr:peptidylprolyl isomerase [Thermoplasmata archaeon]